MKRFALVILLAIITHASNSQVIKYRAFKAAILDSIGELRKANWLSTGLLITFDTVLNRIKIFSKEEPTFFISYKTISKDVFNGHWSYYSALDKNGNEVEIKLFSILMTYQSHIATLIIPAGKVGSKMLVAYRLRLEEPDIPEERLPLELVFNSTILTFWDSHTHKWTEPLPTVSYNTVVTIRKDSTISLSTQSNSVKYGRKLTTRNYKWKTKKEKTDAGRYTEYSFKVTNDLEFFSLRIHRNGNGSISGVTFINNATTMSFMNSEIGYQ